MNPPLDRPRYRPSGRLDPVPFLLCGVIAAGVALLAAFVVHLSATLTMPSVVFAPALASLPVAGFVALAVRVGKCRSPWVGGLLGVFAGALVFLGAFQFGLAAEKGNDHFLRFDLLPGWIDEHVKDGNLWGVKQRARNRANPPPPPAGELVFRWGFLGTGLLAAVAVPAIAGWLTAARPFSEAHNRWLKTWTGRVTRDSGQAVADAVYGGHADALPELVHPILPGDRLDPAAGFATLIVEYVPGDPEAPAYLSVGLMVPAGKKKQVTPNWVADRWEITPAEAAALAGPLAVLGAQFGPPRAGSQPGERVATAIGARVVSLPDQDAGLILSPGNLWVSTFCGFLPLILGSGLATAAGVSAWHYADDLGPVEQGALIAVGVVCAAGTLAWMALYADYLPARYLHARARRAVADRPDPFVHPDDPGAFFAQVIPRKNWGRVMLENADEVGFMLLDEARGMILYEGDRERWAIPRESVVSCELESFDVGPSDPNAGPAFWLVVLKANVGGRLWEAPLSPRPLRLQKLTPSTRRRGAEELRARVRRVLERRT